MIPVIFDTNVYGRIVFDPDNERVTRMIAESHLSVLTFRLIRDELRQTARRKTIRPGKKLRPTLLTTYDQIVSRSMLMPTKEIERQANEYYVEYRRIGGGVGKKRIINDLKIVACASLNRCDMIVSDDGHLMRGSKLLSAIRIVDGKRARRSPNFIGYKELRRIIGLS